MQKLLLLLALAAGLVSCGGGDDAVVPIEVRDPLAACSTGVQRVALWEWLQQSYYWDSQLSAPNAKAPSMDAYFHSMLPNPPDRYSFTQSSESFDQVFSSGYRYGFGYTLVRMPNGDLRVRSVEPMSPVAALGMKRGDNVLSIDGYTPQQVADGALPAVNADGVQRTFVLAGPDGTPRTLVVHSRLFRIQPIAAWQPMDITRDGQPVKVGYLAYNQFVNYSTTLLGFVVQHLAKDGVSEMVLDLRYNGGGSVLAARDLASMLSGSQTDGAVFAHLQFNRSMSALDQDVRFMTAAQRFAQPIEGLKRLVVITSGGTASASELLINGLRPFMQVVLVGSTTYGKPYGFIPRSYCGTTYNAVNFQSVNALGTGDFASGMPVDCYAEDDLDHELGDPRERRLATALGYLATGRCAALPQAAPLVRAKERTYGETVAPGMFVQ